MKLRIPRFHLRTLLVSIAFLSAALASVVIPAKRQANAVRNIETFIPTKGTLTYGPGHGHRAMLGYRHQRNGRLNEVDESQLRYWMRNWFGNEYFGDVVIVQLDNTDFGDSDLSSLESLPNVDFLRLANTRITNAGLEVLSHCDNIDLLALNNTEISDEGVRALKAMNHLRRLSIRNTPITDKSIPILASLDNLKELWLKDTAITEDGFQRLQKALPDCKIQPPTGWSHQRTAMRSSDGNSITQPDTQEKARKDTGFDALE